MTQAFFKTALLAILATGASLAWAAADYPAADFKPSVSYLAPDYASHTSSGAVSAPVAAATAHDPAYPAATFEPKIIYQAPDLAAHSSSASQTTAYDPKYPAAHFEPQIITPAK